MSYGLIYTIPFAAIDNIPCVVEIEKENYSGEVIELVAGAYHSLSILQMKNSCIRLSGSVLRQFA